MQALLIISYVVSQLPATQITLSNLRDLTTIGAGHRTEVAGPVVGKAFFLRLSRQRLEMLDELALEYSTESEQKKKTRQLERAWRRFPMRIVVYFPVGLGSANELYKAMYPRCLDAPHSCLREYISSWYCGLADSQGRTAKPEIDRLHTTQDLDGGVILRFSRKSLRGVKLHPTFRLRCRSKIFPSRELEFAWAIDREAGRHLLSGK